MGQLAATVLIAGSAVTLGRLLAGAAPLSLLKAGIVAMAAVDAYLVFSNHLQAPNAVLVAASPGPGLPQLQSASFDGAGLGYGDFFAAAVVGGILAAERGPQLVAAAGMVLVSLAWDQLFLVYDVLPATIPPAIVLVAASAWRGRSRSYPNVNEYAPAPGSRNVTSSVRSRTRAAWRTSWYRRPSRSTPWPSSSMSTPCDVPGASPSRSTRKGIGARAPGDRTRCASRAWKRKARLPPASSSSTCSRPIVHAPARAQWLGRGRPGGRGAALAERRPAGRRSARRARSRDTSRRAQAIPVGLRLHARPRRPGRAESRSTPSRRWRTRSECS